MGEHLGSFGTPKEPNDVTFEYFGVTLRLNPDVTDVAMIELFAGFGDVDEQGQPVGDSRTTREVLDQIRAVGETLIHPDDVDAFWKATRANRQDMSDLVQLSGQLMAAMTDRPTLLPSDSSGGQSNTDTSSTDVSYLPALRELEGRPDLAVAVLQAAG